MTSGPSVQERLLAPRCVNIPKVSPPLVNSFSLVGQRCLCTSSINFSNKCYGMVVHTGWGGILGHRDNGGHLKACGDCGLGKREIEYGGEQCSQILSGPAAFLVFTLFSTLLTTCFEKMGMRAASLVELLLSMLVRLVSGLCPPVFFCAHPYGHFWLRHW